MRQCILRIDLQRSVKRPDGFRIPFPACQGNTQIVQAFRIIRFERKGFLKCRNCIIIFLPLGKGNAFIEQDSGVIR